MELTFKLDLPDTFKFDDKQQPTLRISAIYLFGLVLITISILIFPKLIIFVILPMTIMSLVMFGTSLQEYFLRKKLNYAEDLLIFLHRIKLLKFFMDIQAIAFYTRASTFLFLFHFCYLGTLLHVVASRWYYYHKVILQEDVSTKSLLVVFVCLFIGLFCSYIRTLINISTSLLFLARQYTPELLASWLLTDGDNNGVPPSAYPTSNNKSFFTYVRNVHNHHYPLPPKRHFWTRTGFLFGLGTLATSAGLLYYAERQAEYTRLSWIAAERQADEAEKTNDFKAVELGLMSKEQLESKWFSK